MIEKTERTIEIKEGCIWEEYPWEILINHEVDIEYMKKCRHAVFLRKEKLETRGKDWLPQEADIYNFPIVIVGYNEGHCGSVGLCGLCVITELQKLPLIRD